MENFDWAMDFPGAVTLCDPEGLIIYMNNKSAEVFASDGGRALIGLSLFDCHSQESNQKIEAIMNSRQPNIYTIEKNGLKKLIYQAPWFQDGNFAGLIELSLEIPFEMPHFIRD